MGMADCTRVGTPHFSSALCIASAFITVASMPDIVSLRPVHTTGRRRDTAKDVAAADHQANLHPQARSRP